MQSLVGFLGIFFCLVLSANPENQWKRLVEGPVHLSQTPKGTLWVTTQNRQLLRSDNEGKSWKIVTQSLTPYSALLTVGEDSIYIANADRVLLSTDGGATFRAVLYQSGIIRLLHCTESNSVLAHVTRAYDYRSTHRFYIQRASEATFSPFASSSSPESASLHNYPPTVFYNAPDGRVFLGSPRGVFQLSTTYPAPQQVSSKADVFSLHMENGTLMEESFPVFSPFISPLYRSTVLYKGKRVFIYSVRDGTSRLKWVVGRDEIDFVPFSVIKADAPPSFWPTEKVELTNRGNILVVGNTGLFLWKNKEVQQMVGATSAEDPNWIDLNDVDPSLARDSVFLFHQPRSWEEAQKSLKEKGLVLASAASLQRFQSALVLAIEEETFAKDLRFWTTHSSTPAHNILRWGMYFPGGGQTGLLSQWNGEASQLWLVGEREKR